MAIKLYRHQKPFEGVIGWFNDFDRWFDDDFFSPTSKSTWVPTVDIEKENGKYLLKADLPGMNKEDIHVELEDVYLTLRGERKSEHADEKENYHRIERTYGSFCRSFRVPEGTTGKDIKAKYHDGVLELSIPAPKVKKPKAIEVKVE